MSDTFPDRFTRFRREVLPRLTTVIDRTFDRGFEIRNEVEAVVFTLGRAGVEDFKDILALVDAGRGVGAFKLVRGMFERLVITRYLRLHPQEVELFRGFEVIHKRKTINQARNAGVDVKAFVSDEALVSIEEAYRIARPLYTETVCKKCETTRDQMSWTKKDLMTLAKEVDLQGLYLTFCHWPTLQLHTTTFGLGIWLRHNGDTTSFDPSANTRFAELAMPGAHATMAFLLEDQNLMFGLGLEREIRNVSEAIEMWPTGRYRLYPEQ